MNPLGKPPTVEERMLQWENARVEDLVMYLSMASIDELNEMLRFADGFPPSHIDEIEQRQRELEEQEASETLAV